MNVVDSIKVVKENVDKSVKNVDKSVKMLISRKVINNFIKNLGN